MSSCPPSTEATSLNISKAYRNSPIAPCHKKYLCVLWKGCVYVQHVSIEGLATASGIQGCVADTALAILKHHKVKPAVKWVDNFIFFQVPSPAMNGPCSICLFKLDLATILKITSPLGIPWHPVSKKGHDFQSSFNYAGFAWDLVS